MKTRRIIGIVSIFVMIFGLLACGNPVSQGEIIWPEGRTAAEISCFLWMALFLGSKVLMVLNKKWPLVPALSIIAYGLMMGIFFFTPTEIITPGKWSTISNCLIMLWFFGGNLVDFVDFYINVRQGSSKKE